MNNKIRIDFVFLFVFLFFSIGCFQIPLDGLISMTLFICWLVSKRKIPINTVRKNYKIYTLLIFLFVYGGLTFGLMAVELYAKYLINFIYLFIPFFIYYVYKGNKDSICKVVRCCRIVLLFWVVVADVYLLFHPGIAPSIAAGTYSGFILAIGGGQFLSYGLTIYSVFIVYKILRRRFNYIDVAIMFFTLLLDILVSSMVTILAGFIGIALVVVVLYWKRAINNRILFVLGICGWIILMETCIVFPFVIEYIFKKVEMLDLSTLSKLKIRAIDIIYMIHDGKARIGSSSFERYQRYIESIDIFIKSPLIGSNRSGDHSSVLDSFSMWGGIGAIPYLLTYFIPDKAVLKNEFSIVLIVNVGIMAFMNPILVISYTTVMGLLVPLEVLNLEE